MSPNETHAGLQAPTGELLTAHTQWAAYAIRKVIADIENKARQEVLATDGADAHHLLPVRGTLQQKDAEDSVKDEIKEFHIGIIGAGAAGLFTAMILDHLNEEYGLNAKYDILEANGEDRLGGRLFSYYFKDPDGTSLGGHQYFDVGAMRFPDIDAMDRTFQLFSEVGIKAPHDPEHPQPGDLIKYYFSDDCVNVPKLYNGIQTTANDFNAKEFKITGLPDSIVGADPGKLVSDQIDFWTSLYGRDPKAFWEGLTSEIDQFSVRQYLTTKGFDYNTIEYLETIESGNRWYDQAVSEMVLEAIDFDHHKPWHCIEGGAQQIAKHMLAKLKPSSSLNKGTPVLYNKSVKAISYVTEGERRRVQVTVRGEETTQPPRVYHAVFNSAPLGAMQHMQLEGLNLDWEVKRAIRNLGYGASCKVGIRFKTLWWKSKFGITKGGVGKTDLPIRNCVYPSYNLADPDDQPGVLLASYTWSQEADRIGALMSRPDASSQLRDLLLHDLARLHLPSRDPTSPDPDKAYEELYAFLSDQYLSHFAWNWSSDPTAVGAFAYFGPGQFRNMYPGLTKTDGKHVVIGEAASAHHAWVVGALESAVRGVYQFLFKHSKRSVAADRATRAYNEGSVRAPFGPLPYEYDRTKEVLLPADLPGVGGGEKGTPETVEKGLPPAIGEIARAQVVFESARLRQGMEILDPEKLTKEDVVAIITRPLGELALA